MLDGQSFDIDIQIKNEEKKLEEMEKQPEVEESKEPEVEEPK